MIAGMLGEGLFAIAHAVALDVGFGHYIEAILVAEVVPIGIVGIVAGAHCVEVELLHDLHVLQHAVAADHVASVGVEFVAVGTLDEDGLAIDVHLCVLDFNLAETYADRHHLKHLAGGIGEGGTQGIEVGRLGSPLERIVHEEHHGLARSDAIDHDLALAVEEFKLHLAARGLDIDVEDAVGVGGIEVGRDADVADVLTWLGEEPAVAADACIAEEVLVLEVGAVAPAEHLNGDEGLLAGNDIAGEVELGREFRILAISHKAAVDPQVHAARSRADVQDDLLTFPVGRNHDLMTIVAHVVVVGGHKRRGILMLASPGIGNVGVLRVTVTIEFPAAGHGDGLPVGVVECGLEEVAPVIDGIALPAELPVAIDAQVTGRCLGRKHRRFDRFVAKESGVHGQTIDGIDLGVLPFLEGLGTGSGGQNTQSK